LRRGTVLSIFNHLEDDGRVRARDVLAFTDEALARQARPLHTSAASGSLVELRGFVQRAIDSGLDILDIFEHFDLARSGEISEEDFSRGLTKLNLGVSRAEVRKMLDSFPGHHGRIKYRDFIRSLRISRGPVDYAVLRAEFRRAPPRAKWRRTFQEMDEAGIGVVDRRDFKRALELLGVDLPVCVMRMLIQAFDRGGDGLVSYLDFIEFADGGDARELRESAKVEARHRGESYLYPGRIERVRANGTFDVSWDDVEHEVGVSKECILPVQAERHASFQETGRDRNVDGARVAFAVGERVEAQYKGKGGRYYAGTISRVNKDDTYDIRYDDGDREEGAMARSIRSASRP